MTQQSTHSSKLVAGAFVQAINQRDVEEIVKLMTEDHVFIDALGARTQGRVKMKAGWEGYFRMVPDYILTVEETFADGAVVVMLGTAQGTYCTGGALQPENRWVTPAAWRAVVRGAQIAEWRVFADNEPIRQIMARTRK